MRPTRLEGLGADEVTYKSDEVNKKKKVSLLRSILEGRLFVLKWRSLNNRNNQKKRHRTVFESFYFFNKLGLIRILDA